MIRINDNVCLQSKVAEKYLQTHISFGIHTVWPRVHRAVVAACARVLEVGQLLAGSLAFSPSPYRPAPGKLRQMFPNETYWNKSKGGADVFLCVSPSPTFHLLSLNCQLESIKISDCFYRENKVQK